MQSIMILPMMHLLCTAVFTAKVKRRPLSSTFDEKTNTSEIKMRSLSIGQAKVCSFYVGLYLQNVCFQHLCGYCFFVCYAI